jgi:hypothetical protein
MKRGRDRRSTSVSAILALPVRRFWQASGAMLTAHFSHPSSGEVWFVHITKNTGLDRHFLQGL